MSLGTELDKRFDDIEQQLKVLQGICTELLQENRQLQALLAKPKRAASKTVKKKSKSVPVLEVMQPEQSILVLPEDNVDGGNYSVASEQQSCGDNVAQEELPVESQSACEIEDAQVDSLSGRPFKYAFAENDGSGQLNLIEVEDEYKTNAVYLVYPNGDTADIYFNQECVSNVLYNAETYLLPFFNCKVQNDSNIVSTIECLQKGTAAYIGDGKWEIVKKTEILIK